MTVWLVLLVAAAVTLTVYAGVVLWLVRVGRGEEARAVIGVLPDCVILFRRLLRDERVPRRRKLLVGALVGYLVMPLDLVPDFVPVAGQLDDVLIVALVLRTVLRSAGPDLLREHWPGPPASLNALMRLTYGSGDDPVTC